MSLSAVDGSVVVQAPTVAVGPSGEVWVSYFDDHFGGPGITVTKSTDGGVSFSNLTAAALVLPLTATLTGGNGVAATEDELDGAKVAPGSSAQQTMEQGLQNDEQANGGAAANLLDDQFSQVGCGFGQDSSGNWWVVIGLQ